MYLYLTVARTCLSWCFCLLLYHEDLESVQVLYSHTSVNVHEFLEISVVFQDEFEPWLL